jgi:serine protease Do
MKSPILKIKDNLKLKEAVVIAVVVSFITAVLVGGAAGFFCWQLAEKLNRAGVSQNQEENQASREIALGREEAITQAVANVSPAVVSIIVTKDLPVMEKYFQEYNPFGDDDFFRQFFGDEFNFQVPQYRQNGTEETEIGGGSGFIVSSDGLILTNKHVAADEKADYTVLTNEGEKIPARVLARDPIEDIAVLKIDKTNLPAVKLGNSDNLKIGQTVIAIGNALGEFRNTVSAGIISGLKRSLTASSGLGQSENLAEVIQTDAAINQGNSGGPLLNLNGEVIGINVAMALGAENIGFSLPINRASRDLEQVKQSGKISYPFLGVRYALVTLEIQKQNKLPVDYGALIIKGENSGEPAITPGSPAAKAGLAENDVILEINGKKINQDYSLAKAIQEKQISETITIKYLSKGEEKTIQVKLEERK